MLAVGLAALAATGTAWFFHRRQASSSSSTSSIRKNDPRPKPTSSSPSFPLSSSIEEGNRSGSNKSQEALVEQRFQACVVQMKSQLSRLAHTQQLSYYGLYKQATVGDYDEYQPTPPSSLDIVASKKYEAWKSRKGMTRVAAMQEYIDNVITFEFTKEMMNVDGHDDDGDGGDDDGEMEGEAIMDIQGMGVGVSTLAGGETKDDGDQHPLHAAARNGDCDALKKVLSSSSRSSKDATSDASTSNVNQTDDAGQSPLHLAADQGHLDCVKVLISHGADVHATDHDGISVLQAAVIGGSVDVTKLLLAVGANPDQQDNDGDTPRSEAVNEGGEMRRVFEERDGSNVLNGMDDILDDEFLLQLKTNGIAINIPTTATNTNKSTTSQQLQQRPNVEQELKNLSNIQIELDDDGDM